MAKDSKERAEHRWPVVVALVLAVAMYAALPSSFLPNIRMTVVALIVLLLIPVLAFNPVRFTRQSRWSRTLSVSQSILLLVANQVAVIALVYQLVTPESGDSGTRLLLSAAQVWAVNVIAVALVLWEIDRGGPVIRSTSSRSDIPAADIRFPQDEDHDTIDEVAARSSKSSDWRPAFIDYLYSSLSNSMAFSASDSMPLSTRAKVLMGLEALSGFIILALVIARAVSLLG